MTVEKYSGLVDRKNIFVCEVFFGGWERGRAISRRSPSQTAEGTQQVTNWELKDENA